MRLLDKFFGDYRVIFPALPEGTEARAQLDEVKAPLEELVSKVKDHLEIVPAADHEAFVFFGHPPDHFGIAWLHDGKVTSPGRRSGARRIGPTSDRRISMKGRW